ncbi:putative gustatory receptor 28b [Artemia franciscana]|uniref:putative gustatory receptor 28b n=1 Tax=Artemia franciscana TaxID=6661 RepID=UPI0032DA8240
MNRVGTFLLSLRSVRYMDPLTSKLCPVTLDKAREPLRIIHELDLTKYDSAVQMQLLMFCNQISSRQLHPTAAGFFNLSKQMVCTVASILATYVIVLMQFKSND